jgi:prevent-host-death family protein
MTPWSVQNAKARLSELLDRCLTEGPQPITRRGVEIAVVVPAAEWHRLRAAARPSLKALLLTDRARGPLPLPARGIASRRTPPVPD